MATIINNPSGTPEDSSVGVMVGIIIAIVLVVLFFVFAWPSIRAGNTTPAGNNAPAGASTNINVTLPSPAASQGASTY
jgi:hypothetical protein